MNENRISNWATTAINLDAGDTSIAFHQVQAVVASLVATLLDSNVPVPVPVFDGDVVKTVMIVASTPECSVCGKPAKHMFNEVCFCDNHSEPFVLAGMGHLIKPAPSDGFRLAVAAKKTKNSTKTAPSATADKRSLRLAHQVNQIEATNNSKAPWKGPNDSRKGMSWCPTQRATVQTTTSMDKAFALTGRPSFRLIEDWIEGNKDSNGKSLSAVD